MRKFLSIAAIASVLVLAGGCKKDAADSSSQSAAAPQVLLDQPIDVSTADATVDVPGRVHVVVPKGALAAKANVKITELPSSVPVTDSKGGYKLMAGCNVEIGDQTTFAKPLKITYPIDAGYITDPAKRRRVAAVYYDSGVKRWIGYPIHTFDDKNSTITFETSHLTPTGWLDYLCTAGYTELYEYGRFNIYYTTKGSHAPMSNKDYNNDADHEWYKDNPQAHPHYVLDVARGLAVAANVYTEKHKLTLPRSNINVYIKDNGGDGQYSPFSESIFINNTVKKDTEWKDDPRATNELYLQKATAHELFHYAQDYYYAFIAGMGTNLWWLEALATQADCIVDPKAVLPEGVMYARKATDTLGNSEKALHYDLSRSWNDCGTDPAYYVAGAFLTYMSNYRQGAKLDVVKLMTSKAPGIRTAVLDAEIKSQLSSSIGKEFADYVRYLYESRNADFNLMNPQFTATNPDAQPCFQKVDFGEKEQSKTVNFRLPALSAKVVKFCNRSDKNGQLELTWRITWRYSGAAPDWAQAYLCDYKTMSVIKAVERDQKTTVAFDKNAMPELLIICTDRTAAQPEVVVEAQLQNGADPVPTGKWDMTIGGFKRFCPEEQTYVEFLPYNGGVIPVTVGKGGALTIDYANTDNIGNKTTCKGSGTISKTGKPDEYRFQITFRYEKWLKRDNGMLLFFTFDTKTDVTKTIAIPVHAAFPITGTLEQTELTDKPDPKKMKKEYTFNTFSLSKLKHMDE